MNCHCVRLHWLLFAAVIVGAASLAAAQSPQVADKAGAEERFRQFDKNGDGKITREESGNARWFDALDRNEMPGVLFDRLDTNKDGFVTEDEMKALWRTRQ